jgi:hypothetical protein
MLDYTHAVRNLPMLGYFRKKLEEVLDALLEPFWLRVSAWTKDVSWQGRTLLLVLVLVLTGLVALVPVYWNSLPLFYRAAVAFGKVVTSAPTQIPLDSSLTFKVRETSRRLAEGLRADLNDPDKLDPPSAWTLAQEAAASCGMIKINAEAVRTYFRNLEIACNCWQETPDRPPHVAVSGWVLFALAELNFPATEAEVRFFLKEQKRDGWWPVFQATDKEAFASTFGTAWALIGLQTQLQNGLMPQTLQEEVSNAIGNGSSWLIGHQGSKSRWKDYPLNEIGEDSDSLSGLVIHALHLTASDSITQLKKDWLDNLPSIRPANDRSQNPVWVTLRVGAPMKDESVQITLPWTLIATADAYAAGNYRERTSALLWMEDALDREAVIHAETQVQNWWRAEFLLALRYVLARSSLPQTPSTSTARCPHG